MKNLRAATRQVLQTVEQTTGKSIQFMRDDSLAVLATMSMARDGAAYHVENDGAKTNLAAILEQHGIAKVRSL